MRLWHLLALVVAASVVLTLARDPMTRTLLIVFVTGLGGVASCLASIMALFQTIGAVAEAKSVPARVEALAATSLVLWLGTVVMAGWFFAGFWLVAAFV